MNWSINTRTVVKVQPKLLTSKQIKRSVYDMVANSTHDQMSIGRQGIWIIEGTIREQIKELSKE